MVIHVLTKYAWAKPLTYHHFINKKPINTDYSASTENIESYPTAPKFKVNLKVRIIKYKNTFSKGYTENWSRKNIYY